MRARLAVRFRQRQPRRRVARHGFLWRLHDAMGGAPGSGATLGRLVAIPLLGMLALVAGSITLFLLWIAVNFLASIVLAVIILGGLILVLRTLTQRLS